MFAAYMRQFSLHIGGDAENAASDNAGSSQLYARRIAN